MFGRDTCTLTLYAVDISCGNLTSKQGVFRVVLEVATAEGIAMEVHARTQDDIAAIFLGLIADGLTDTSHEFGVPGGSQTGTNGEGSGIVGLVGARTSGVDTHTCRAVGEYCGGDAKTGDGRGGAGSTCHEVGFAAYYGICAEEVVSTANQKFGFLLKGHGLEHFVDVCCRELRLSICCHSECGC